MSIHEDQAIDHNPALFAVPPELEGLRDLFDSPDPEVEEASTSPWPRDEREDDGYPAIAPPPSGTVTLLQSYDGSGVRSTAKVRELTGADEEFLATWDSERQTLIDLLDMVLRRGVEEIDGEPVTPESLGRLYIFDRDLLYMEIVKQTRGDDREIETTCQSCETSNTVTFKMSSEFPLVTDAANPLGNPIDITLRNGSVARVGSSKSGDWLRIGKKSMREDLSVAQRDTHLLAMSVISVDGQPVADPLAWAAALGMSDRRTIIKRLDAEMPRFSFKTMEVNCVECNSTIRLPLIWADLLYL
jgi:hypothetical protein